MNAREIWLRLTAWSRRSRLERELSGEIQDHIALLARDLERDGMSAADARATARRQVGNVTGQRERSRDYWGFPAIEALLQDFKYAARGLRRSPGFTATVVVTIGLGIGANAAMFSVVDRLLFRPPPMLRDAGATHRVYLALTYRGKESPTNGISIARYLDLARWTTSFERFAQYSNRDLAIGNGTDSREMRVAVVSASFFDLFDAPPVRGRYFTAAEDMPPSGTPVVVIAYGYWMTAFGGRHDALGSSMRIGPLQYTIIGVAPEGFGGLTPDRPPVAFIPLSAYAGTQHYTSRGKTWWATYGWTWSSTIAQRKASVSEAVANADLTQAFLRSYAVELAERPEESPASIAKPRAFVGSILSERGPNSSTLSRVATWISGVALVVLLIACANVANLLLARSLNRRREIAVRLALGVSRGRLLGQLLTESVLLALLGGVAGLAIAQMSGTLLRSAFLPQSNSASVAGDPRTLIFALIAALVTGVMTGLAPALQLRSVTLTSDLKSGAREGTYRHSVLRGGLLVAQGALSVLLLIGAGLFVRSLENVRTTRLGYDVAPMLLLEVNARGVPLDSAQMELLLGRLLAGAKEMPQVENATRQATVPFWSSESTDLRVAGIDSVEKLGEFDLNRVGPEFFTTLGTHIIRGRGITAADINGAPLAMVVSDAMAKRLWPTQEVIGQCLKVGRDTTLACTYVVGVAEDIKANKLDNDPTYYYYLSVAQSHPELGGIFIRTKAGDPASKEAVRKRLQQLMPGDSYVTITPFSEILGQETQSWQLGARMFTMFGALALTLAAIGLFSVISYNVAQRKHELGVRVALGAQARDVMRLVLSQGLRLGVGGAVIGLAIALAAGRWIAPLLFNESPRDPAVFGVVTAVLVATTLVACAIPAFRATKADPNLALRSE